MNSYQSLWRKPMLLSVIGFILLLQTLFLFKTLYAEDFVVKGSLGFGVRTMANPAAIKYWISCGDWRNRSGIDDPRNETYSAVVNRSARNLFFSGSLDDCQVRDNGTFASLGNLNAVFDYSMSNITYDFSPIHNLPIFAIGHSPAAGVGSVIITSPDGSVRFSTGNTLSFSFTDKYKPYITSTTSMYGPFATLADMNLYIGPRFTPGHVLFSGTEGRGLGAWLMANQEVTLTLNGVPENVVISGGDLHGDLVPNAAPICNAGGSTINGAYANQACFGKTTTVKLNATLSNDPDLFPSAITYSWSSNCPSATLDSPTSPTPTLTFDSERADGTPSSCSVFLVVSDGQAASSCQSSVSVSPCSKDCLGQINGPAQFDRCGVCQGDGNSCLGCKQANVRPNLLEVDINSKSLSNLAKKVSRNIRTTRKGPSTVEETKLLDEAQAIHLRIWQQINSIPPVYQFCENQQFCVSTSYVGVIQEVETESSKLFAIVKTLAKRWQATLIEKGISGTEAKSRRKGVVKKAKALKLSIEKELATIPNSSSVCN